MSAMENRTFSLLTEQGQKRRAAAVERWLREKVVAAARDMEAEPGRGIPAARVFAELRAFHAQRQS